MKQKMVVLVGVDSDEEAAGYCVIRQDTLEEHDGDLFALFYNDGPGDTYDSWDAAVAAVKDCDGEIVDVLGAIAY